MFNPCNPNAFTVAMMERQQALDNAARYLVDLFHDDVDINDEDVQARVFKHYALEDLTEAEKDEICRKVDAAIA